MASNASSLVARIALLTVLTLVGAILALTDDTSAYRERNDLLSGKIYPDAIEYFDFAVDDAVVDVTVRLARVRSDEDCGNQCDSELELFLRFGAFPTTTSYDQRVVVSQTERADMVVEQLRTGRYYLLLSGGQPFDSAPPFVGSRAELQYSLNISHSTCEEPNKNGSAKCPLGAATTALEIAPPMDASIVPNAYYKPSSNIVGGCADALRPILSYTFHINEPKWEMTLTLSTTFAAGFRMTVFTNNRNLTELPRHDISNSTDVMQSTSILPGAGFRKTSVRFMAPPAGRWVVIISGNLTDNSTCATNGGAPFALEASHASVNCSGDAESNNDMDIPTFSAGGDRCSLKMVTFEEKRTTARGVDELLGATFSHDELIPRDSNSSQAIASMYKTTIGSHLAGANLVLRVEATTNLKAFQIIARINAFPTSQQFDYRFRTSEALSVTPVPTKFNSTTTNKTIDMEGFEWKTILYPKTGVWYMLLVADDADRSLDDVNATEVALNVSLRTFACPMSTHDGCSSHGKCTVTVSATGQSYSSCHCNYGYGGAQCDAVSVDPTYRGTQIFFTMASNLAILPVTWLCLRRQLFAEGFLFAATGTTSTFYHACNFDFFCALRYRDLHHLDCALSLNMFAMLVVHLSGARNQLKAGLVVFYLVMVMILTTADNYSSSSIAWIVLGGVSCIQFAMAIAYYVVVGSTRMGLGKTIALRTFLFHSKNFDRRYGIAGVALLGIALTCFFTATSSSYWILHSLWHVFAMLAAFSFIGLRLNDRYQLVTPDFNIDVLLTPPQYRFAVSSVKSVDILEDTSGSGAGNRRIWRH